MTTALVAIVVLLAIVVAILTYELHGMPRLRRRCIVNLRDGADSIEGLLWRRHGRIVLLKDARLMRANGEITPADGEVLLDRDQIAFIQVL